MSQNREKKSLVTIWKKIIMRTLKITSLLIHNGLEEYGVKSVVGRVSLFHHWQVENYASTLPIAPTSYFEKVLAGQRAAESGDKIALAIVRDAWECTSFASLRNKGLKRATDLLTRIFPYVRRHVNYFTRTFLDNFRDGNEKKKVND